MCCFSNYITQLTPVCLKIYYVIQILFSCSVAEYGFSILFSWFCFGLHNIGFCICPYWKSYSFCPLFYLVKILWNHDNVFQSRGPQFLGQDPLLGLCLFGIGSREWLTRTPTHTAQVVQALGQWALAHVHADPLLTQVELHACTLVCHFHKSYRSAHMHVAQFPPLSPARLPSCKV